MKNIHWYLIGITYLGFFLWYTNLSGPLTKTEIEKYLSNNSNDFENLELFTKFLENDDGKSFYMVNYLDLNETPPSLPATGIDASAWDLLNHYFVFMFPNLFSRACHPVLTGPVISDALDLLNVEEGKSWDYAAVVRYRSRRDMVEIITNSNFFDRHDYKIAALEKTIAIPVNPRFIGDLRLILFMFFLIVGLSIQIIRKN